MLDHPRSKSALIVEEQVSFTPAGMLDGVKKSIPIAFSVFSYGLVFGVLTGQAKLSLLEVLLMSGLVFAGASQFVALGLWVTPLPVATIILTTLIVNLRILLMGVSVSPWFSRLSPLKAYGTLFFLGDENWALLMGEFAKGKRDAAFLLGSGLTLYVAWLSAGLVGRELGNVLPDPTLLGLDFAFTAVFIALLVGLWKGKADILPWLVAAIVAVAAEHWLPGKWYILLGALAGSLVGVARHAD